MSIEKLSLTNKVFYGLPGLPLAMLGLPLFIYLPSFYSVDLGLSLTAVGLALLLARSFDVITDPLIGLLNDHYPKLKTITWRRKSFILLGLPLLLLGLNFLLKPVDNISPSYLFIWSFITYLGWTLINIPWLAMGAEMSDKYHEKSDLASSREIFSVLGTVVVIVFLAGSEAQYKTSLANLANILMLVIPLSLIPLLWKVSLENTLISIPIAKGNKSKLSTLINKNNIQLIKHPAVKRLLPAYFINSIANALPATLFILYVNYVIQTPDQVGILLIAYFLSAIIGIPFWLYLARKTDKHTSWKYALYGSIASFVCVPLIGHGDFNAFLIVCLGTGFCLGADVVMPSSIQADIAQNISQDTSHKLPQNVSQDHPKGMDKEISNPTGLLFGLWGMLTKLSLAIAIGIAFPLLDLVGLNANSTVTNDATQMGTITLILLYALIPIILKLWVVINIRNFPYDKTYFSSDSASTNLKLKEGIDNEPNDSKNLNRPISFTPTYKRM